MKVVIQRVKEASVSIAGRLHEEIRQGYLLLVGFSPEDGPEDIRYAVRKISQMRLFSDEEGKMNQSLQDIKGEVLSISQFTLLAETKKGNRPSFTGAAKPEQAAKLYDQFNTQLAELVSVKAGIFGEDMQISLINDGPVTIVLDTKQK